MNIGALISSGSIEEAITALGEALRGNPADYRRRTTLFSLLCYVGNYQRAEQQLGVLSQEGPEMQLGAESWRAVLTAARERDRVFDEGRSPALALGLRAPDFFEPCVEVVRHMAAGNLEAAGAAAATAEELRPRCPCRLAIRAGDSESADGPADLRDADDRLGPFLELFLGSQYAWLPLSAVDSLEIPQPRHLLDLLYTPVTLRTALGGVSAVMPVLYPRTAAHTDAQVRLGRMTLWQDADGLALGAGARLMATPAEDVPLLQIRSLRVESDGSAATSDPLAPGRAQGEA